MKGIRWVVLGGLVAGCIGDPGPDDEIGHNELAICSAPAETAPVAESASGDEAATTQGWYMCACPLHDPACDDCQVATSRDECLAGICERADGSSAACRWVRWSPFPGPLPN
jgi:hypothetical protein